MAKTKKKKRKIKYYRLALVVMCFVLVVFLVVQLFSFFTRPSVSKKTYLIENHQLDLESFKEKDGLMMYDSDEYISHTGIDVSFYQKEIDWNKVKNYGIEFAMIRCGFRGVVDGVLYEDSMYEQNIENAQRAGIPVGVYFFSSAITLDELIEEIEFVEKMIYEYDIQYPIAFDMEPADGARISDLSSEDKTMFAKTFCDYFNDKGYQTLIYGNKGWLTNHLNIEDLSDYNLWYAAYIEQPELEHPFSIWQYSSHGMVDGIEGRVDMNLYVEKKKV